MIQISYLTHCYTTFITFSCYDLLVLHMHHTCIESIPLSFCCCCSCRHVIMFLRQRLTLSIIITILHYYRVYTHLVIYSSLSISFHSILYREIYFSWANNVFQLLEKQQSHGMYTTNVRAQCDIRRICGAGISFESTIFALQGRSMSY